MELSHRLRTALDEKGLETGGESQIIPVIIGDNDETIRIAERLQEKGYLVFPIRPPSVPRGSSRLRISLTAGIEWDEIKDLPEIIKG